jgi:hypothetical protein
MRPAGIEPAACGLKDRCSLAPRREPLTTELRARAAHDATTSPVAWMIGGPPRDGHPPSERRRSGRHWKGSEIGSDVAGAVAALSVGPL